MSDGNKYYLIMDGRAHSNMDRALVCATHDTYTEGHMDLSEWPTDHVLVERKEGDSSPIVFENIVAFHPEWFEEV